MTALTKEQYHSRLLSDDLRLRLSVAFGPIIRALFELDLLKMFEMFSYKSISL